MVQISRQDYAQQYGPTVGDKIRLADTDLYIEIERDLITHGDEAVFGGGKTLRDGMGSDPEITNEHGALDLVITNATIVDAVLGVTKADIGIRDGKIVGIGKAGNPSTMSGVTPTMVIGAGTEALSGEGLIATAGGFDTHVHMVSPQQVYAAISNGVTTFVGGGTGPADGTRATTCTPGPWNIARMLQAAEGLPINWGVLGKGNSSDRAPLAEQIEAGACGLKDHEDWGCTPEVIRTSLDVADEYDIQISIHTDSLNESGYVENTIAAIDGRTIHTYHTEGCGGGHVPDIMKIAAYPNVLPSSTNPTRPFCADSVAEAFPMIMVTHHLNPNVPTDVAFAHSRVRPETMAGEDVLHDIGAISMYSSDSQAMGRCGENWVRLMQTADKMKKVSGPLPEDKAAGNDNYRVLRYVAKLTINPAITNGMSHLIGSLEVGKLADVVLWKPAFFGAKPFAVVKGGMINWFPMGDPNASIPTPEPVYYRPMFGAYGMAQPETCVTFVSQAAYNSGVASKLGLQRRIEPVRNTRTLTKRHMVRNDTMPDIAINPETYEVTVNGRVATAPAVDQLSLSQRYFFS